MSVSACPYPESGETIMSNFDHGVSENAEEVLAKEQWAAYTGWNFYGRVWKDRTAGDYCCEVWTYGRPREVMRAASLTALMDVVSNEYGHQ